jgi:hypothetical protein
MWLAIVFYCTTMSVDSCELAANTKNLWYNRTECEVDAMEMSGIIEGQGLYSRWACIELGEST